MLPNPSDKLVDGLQKTVYEFVWNRKQDRISRKTAIKNTAKRGLGIPKLTDVIKALKLIWVRKLKTSDHKWKNIITASHPKVTLLEQPESSLPIEELHLNKLWNAVFQAYEQSGRNMQVESSEELAAESIFCNNKTQTGNRSIYPKNWIDNGVFYIKNILKENGASVTFNQLRKTMELI